MSAPAASGYDDARQAHAGCMICGDRGDNPQTLGLSFDRHADGSVSTTCGLGRRFQGYDGILHGGMIGALLDAAMTHCLFVRGLRALTAEMTVRFVAPVPTDRPFTLTAQVVSRRRRIHWLEARLTMDAKLLARATARFIEPRPASLHGG
jgi:uncharacterized protein (TIGR00369 family)